LTNKARKRSTGETTTIRFPTGRLKNNNHLSEKRKEDKEKQQIPTQNSKVQRGLGEASSTAQMAGRILPPMIHIMEETKTP